MTTQITLTLSNQQYETIQQLAEHTQQDIHTILHTIVSEGLTHGPAPSPKDRIAHERQAYHQLHPELWQKYPHQHVAIHNGRLIDHDPDGLALSQRIHQQYPNQFVLMRQVEDIPERILHFRSPRFVQ